MRPLLVTVASLGIALSALGQEASFEGIGFLDNSDPRSLAFGVSPDGKVVTGQSTSALGPEGFRWENGVMVGLGDLPGGVYGGIGLAASCDGSVVVGDSWSENGPDEAFRWEGGVMEALGDLPGGLFGSQAWDVSCNGEVVIGTGTPGTGDAPFAGAFRWESGVMEALPDLPGGDVRSYGAAVSADGRIVAGTSNGPDDTEAVRWVEGVVEGLGFPPGGHSTVTRDMSADGSILVGRVSVDDPNGTEAFIWREGQGMDYLPDLPGGSPYREAQSISGDGRVVVGVADGGSGFEVFIWTEELGIRGLRSVLEDDLGLDLTGWDLGVVPYQALNDDGTVIVGAGTNPDGDLEGWRAILPPGIVISSDPNPPSLPEAEITIYPNPASDVLVVKSSAGQIEIVDVLGRLVLTARSDKGETVINIAALPTGTYVVRAGGQSRVITVRH